MLAAKVSPAKRGKNHGFSRTRLHSIWCGMMSRCRPTAKYTKPYYYDRGVRVCVEWHNFVAFRAWATANGYGEDLWIDRKDNDGPYCPENCRWATRDQQMMNRGKRRDAQTSKYIGVSWCGNAKKWRAQIVARGQSKHIGLFLVEEEAAKAYDRKAREFFGEFASLNFKEGAKPS